MIRPVSLAHPPAMAAIHRAAFGTQSWSIEAFAALLGNAFTYGSICDDGFVLARALAGEAEILTLAVMPQQRRQGIGRSLLAAALAEAQQRGARQVFLEVSQENIAALSLYTDAGFLRTGFRHDYYGSGQSAVLLSRTLCLS